MKRSDRPDTRTELELSRARVIELELKLADMTRELETTNEGVLALYAELDDAQAELTEKNRLVLQADRLKGEFLANMSHEIRTPMNAILGLTEALLSGPTNESQFESLSVIREAGHSLLALINDILDFSKIEAGMLELEMVDFAPRTLFESTTELLRALAQQKKLDLRLWLDPDLAPVVRGDRHRIRQVLLNLMGNAIKFTERGEVLIRVFTSKPGEITVTVKDTGRGIAAASQARLFQPFVQEDGSITRQHGGTGLGLSISKRLVERMGGEIWVESSLGHGSTFGFRLPLPSDQSPQLPVPLPRAAARSALSGRVLVAEDHKANQLVAKYQLESLGLEVEFVENGRQAVAAVLAGGFDLVLMDCHMPDMSGYQATREIRQAEATTGQHIPILAMTAGALAGDREQCLQAGMDDYVSKPIEPTTLFQMLAAWLKPPTSLLDFAVLEKNYGSIHFCELGILFQQDARVEMERLLQASGQRDLAGVARHGHGMRGLCAAICSTRLVAHCDALREAHLRQDWSAIEQWCRVLAEDVEEACRLLEQLCV